MDRLDGVQVRNVFVESFADANAKLVTEGFEGADARDDYLIGLGISKAAIKRNVAFRTTPVDFIEKRIYTLEEMGLDAVKVMNRGMKVVKLGDIALHDRVNNLIEQNLDATKVVNAYANILNYHPGTVNGKLAEYGDILQTIGSPHETSDVVNASPVLLGLSMDKIRVMIRLLAGSVNPDYIASLSPKQLSYFATLPIDSVFASVAKQKTTPGYADKGLRRGQIAAMQARIPVSERRRHNLDIICHSTLRKKIGMTTINTYLNYDPIKPDEEDEILNTNMLYNERGGLRNRQFIIANLLKS
jgi:hypothetical protein